MPLVHCPVFNDALSVNLKPVFFGTNELPFLDNLWKLQKFHDKVYHQTILSRLNMPKIQIIIFACAGFILFSSLSFLLIGLLLKMYQSSKAKFSKTMADLEQDKAFKL